jgi:hypothetical protein
MNLGQALIEVNRFGLMSRLASLEIDDTGNRVTISLRPESDGAPVRVPEVSNPKEEATVVDRLRSSVRHLPGAVIPNE